MESVRNLAGQTATVSFWAKAASGTPKIGVEFKQGFGQGGSPSADVNTSFGTVTLSTSWARYEVTGTVPSISGKTIGTDGTFSDFLGLILWLSAGSNYDSRSGSIGNQNATFSLWGVKVEAGSVATAFEQEDYPTELRKCQRYYWTTTQGYQCMGQAYTTANVVGFFNCPTTMRYAPVAIASVGAATDYYVYKADANTATCSAVPTFLTSTTKTIGVTFSVASGLVAGNVTICGSVTANGVFGFSADL